MLQPDTPITVVLTATEVNQVLGILAEAGPFRIVAPLIEKIRQAGAEAERVVAGSIVWREPGEPGYNGLDRPAPAPPPPPPQPEVGFKKG